MHGTAALLLMSSDSEGIAAQIALTNRHLSTSNGQTIADHKLSLRRTLLVLDEDPVFIDTIAIRNFGLDRVMLPLSLEFSTTFESMFVLRGAPAGKRGRMHAPEWDETALRFSYEGADGVLRTLLVDFSLPPVVAPRTTERSVAHFELSLEAQASQDLIVTFRVDERPVGTTPPGLLPSAQKRGRDGSGARKPLRTRCSTATPGSRRPARVSEKRWRGR